MQNVFHYTDIQRKALALLGSSAGNIMLFGGSRSGKTFVICSSLVIAAMKCPGLRIAVLRRYIKDVRQSIVLDTFPKVLDLRFGISHAEFEKMFCMKDLIFRTDAGSEIWFGGLADNSRAEKILGKEYGLIYFNEVSQMTLGSVEMARTRLAMKVPYWRNRCFYDCNPTSKNHWVYRMFIEKVAENRAPLIFPEDYVSLQMNPIDNRENLSEEYLGKTLGGMSGKVRQRFLLGDWTEDQEGALWKSSVMIDPFRIRHIPDDLERIVIAVDPAVTGSAKSDHTGIIVAGMKEHARGNRHYYVLADLSLVASPVEWARKVANAFDRYRANYVVAEVNQGGDLVVSVLRNAEITLPIHKVHATRGKILRAEPVAALYEQGLVHHVGEFPKLEDEMSSYTGTGAEESPDRMDALVWAITDLSKDRAIEIGSFRFV